MRKMIVGFSTGHSWISKLIKWMDKSPYSHVYVKWYSSSIDRHIIYQASGIEVTFINQTMFDSDSTTLAELELDITDDQFKACMQFCIDKADTPYGIKQIIGMAWVRLCKVFGKKVKNPFRDGQATYVCSELVYHLVTDVIGYPVFDFDPESDGPMELYNQIVKIAKTPNL